MGHKKDRCTTEFISIHKQKLISTRICLLAQQFNARNTELHAVLKNLWMPHPHVDFQMPQCLDEESFH